MYATNGLKNASDDQCPLKWQVLNRVKKIRTYWGLSGEENNFEISYKVESLKKDEKN